VFDKKKLDMETMTKGTDEQKYNALINNDNRDQNDMISMLAITELLDIKKLKTISRIKFDQVGILTKLFLFSKTFGDQFTADIGNLILQLQISTNGLGRKELVQLVQQRTDLFDMAQMKPKTSKDIFR
jgi:hypothetical protein